MARQRTSRDEWRKRVDRWKNSGLTAKEFAADMDINAGTLQFWQFKLGREAKRPRQTSREVSDAIVSSVVEVCSTAPATMDTRFEVELCNGRRVRVPSGSDFEKLKTLLAVLERSA